MSAHEKKANPRATLLTTPPGDAEKPVDYPEPPTRREITQAAAPDRHAETAPERLAGLSAADLAPLAALAGSASARVLLAGLLKRCCPRGLAVTAIQGPSRSRGLVRIRHALIWYARTRLGCSFPELGRIFHRDHSTAQYAVRSFSAALDEQKTWAVGLAERLCEHDEESYSQ